MFGCSGNVVFVLLCDIVLSMICLMRFLGLGLSCLMIGCVVFGDRLVVLLWMLRSGLIVVLIVEWVSSSKLCWDLWFRCVCVSSFVS